MRKYYYLVSSLPDVVLQGERKGMLLDEFLDFCELELHPEDYKNLKMMYLFNDIKNAFFFRKEDDPFNTPSFYSKEEFLENLNDHDYFMSFLSYYFFNRKNGVRLYPSMNELDEITQIFYESIDELDMYDVVKRYYIECELILINISRAMVMKHRNEFDENKFIKYGDYIERILKANSLDFGMSVEFPFLEKMAEALVKGDYVKFEEEIEKARWYLLDELVEDFFSVTNVFAIGKKLESVDRWKKLSPEIGKAKLDELIESIKSKIAFPPEFQRVGGRKNDQR